MERGDLVHGPCGDVRCVVQTLILTVATDTTANTAVEVTIELDNKATAQDAVVPTVRPVSGGQSAVQSNGFAVKGALRPSSLPG